MFILVSAANRWSRRRERSAACRPGRIQRRIRSGRCGIRDRIVADTVSSGLVLVFADRALINQLSVLRDADTTHREIAGGEGVEQTIEPGRVELLGRIEMLGRVDTLSRAGK